jgi:hypothetical protein
MPGLSTAGVAGDDPEPSKDAVRQRTTLSYLVQNTRGSHVCNDAGCSRAKHLLAILAMAPGVV